MLIKAFLTCLLSISLSSLILSSAFAAPSARLISEWNQSNELNTASLDHSRWQTILDSYVVNDASGVNLVDYKNLKEHRNELDTYIKFLSKTDPRKYKKTEQFAYWINLYNATTMQLIVDNYPVKSIREISEGFFSSSPWNRKWINVANKTLSLNNIEHGILRPIWQDARIHYAVNCASLGCPNLATTAYTAANSEALLNQQAHDFINHPRGVNINIDNKRIEYSSIFHWYKGDFGDSFSHLLNHWYQHAGEALASELNAIQAESDFDKKHSYDWQLNNQKN